MKTQFFVHLAQTIDTSTLPTTDASGATIKLILNIVFTIMGAVAVLVVTIAGFRYVLSRGNSQEITQAKNAILYAVIGLIVIIFAFSIVNFVIFRVS